MTIVQAIKTRIKELLAERDMSLYKLERVGGISPNTTKGIMAGKNKSVNFKVIMQIIRAFGMSTKDFFDSSIFESDDLDFD
jgi:DNA-binding Xre family transcriptional regulator